MLRKSFFILLLISVLFTGCASFPVVTEVMDSPTLEKLFASSLFAEYINDDSWKISELKLLRDGSGQIEYFDAVLVQTESQKRRNIVLDQKMKQFSLKAGEKTAVRDDALSVNRFVQVMRLLEEELFQEELVDTRFELTVKPGFGFYGGADSGNTGEEKSNVYLYVLQGPELSKKDVLKESFRGYAFWIITSIISASDEGNNDLYLIYFD